VKVRVKPEETESIIPSRALSMYVVTEKEEVVRTWPGFCTELNVIIIAVDPVIVPEILKLQ
jgi:hypothetical protein